MKKGIALVIVLIFIIVMGLLVTSAFRLTTRVALQSQKQKTIAQSAVIVQDIKKILDGRFKKIKSNKELSEIFSEDGLIYDKKSGLDIHIKISPLSNKININAALINGKKNDYIIDILNRIYEKYNLLNPLFFTSLILDTIDTDDIEREPFSEISLQNINYTNGSVYNQEHFLILQNYYAKITQDKNIFKIPWGKLIYFGRNVSGYDSLDCDRLSDEMIATLGIYGLSKINCSTIEDSKYKKFIKMYLFQPFKKMKHYEINVKISYNLGNINEGVSYMYDIKNLKACKVELF